MDEVIVGVDLGGTQMRVGLFDRDLHLRERLAEPTLAHEGQESVIGRLLDLIERAIPTGGDTAVVGIGVSAPGPINPRTGTILSPPNLPGWRRVALRRIVEERLGHTTYLGNDANVAALAETTRGAAHGYKYVIYLTVSTGIGSGIIDDGHLIIGSSGLGAEAGHMIVVADGRVSTLEKEAAGPAIAAQAVEQIRAGKPTRIPDLVGGDLGRITAKTVGQAAAQGDQVAQELIRRAGWMVGLGIVSLAHLFNPQIIVVGGGVSKTGDLLFEPMREAVQQYTIDSAYCDNLPIVPAALGDNVALIGAAALVATHGGTRL